MRKLIFLIMAIMALAYGYYAYLSPSAKYEKLAQQALDELSASVASKDQKRIDETLQKRLTDNSHIKLAVNFFTLSQMDGGKPQVQEFDKTSFITFIDNIVYSVQNYGYEARISHFNLATDRQSAELTFLSHEWAEGVSYYSGMSLNMDFDSHTECVGHVVFTDKKAVLDSADCSMQLKSLPKAGQETKLRDPAMIRDLLR